MKIAAFLALALLVGCAPKPQPRHVTILIDISASIAGDGSPMDTAVQGIAGKLQRGDDITVFPICDSAYVSRTEPIHFQISEKREAFNEETTRFRKDFKARVGELTSNATCKKTAILGTLARAASVQGDVYILTDGVEDADLRFDTDRRLSSVSGATKLAVELGTKGPRLGKVRLGLVGSKDFDSLPSQRQSAIVTFWKTYLSELSSDSQVESPELLR